jgi:hypothetical protein
MYKFVYCLLYIALMFEAIWTWMGPTDGMYRRKSLVSHVCTICHAVHSLMWTMLTLTAICILITWSKGSQDESFQYRIWAECVKLFMGHMQKPIYCLMQTTFIFTEIWNWIQWLKGIDYRLNWWSMCHGVHEIHVKFQPMSSKKKYANFGSNRNWVLW